MALQTDTLKEKLRQIDPTKDDVIDAMVGAIEEWLKTATITIPALTVTVNTDTGKGTTEQETISNAIS